MTLTITDDAMISDQTSYYAGRAVSGSEIWFVTWLPGARLTRNQAVTAMTLAEMVAGGIGDHTDKRWPHIDGWAAELGLSGPDAVGKISDLGAELAERCPDCGRASCTGEDCYWPDEAGIPRPHPLS